jgi:hypothetical protein
VSTVSESMVIAVALSFRQTGKLGQLLDQLLAHFVGHNRIYFRIQIVTTIDLSFSQYRSSWSYLVL